MSGYLHIYDRRERWLVGAADVVLGTLAVPWRLVRRPRAAPLRRILLLRLERIGDLLMTLDAIALVCRSAPDAEIDLLVGSWNAPLARLIPGVNRVDVLDAPWLARGATGSSLIAIARRALELRRQRYDLGVNFEPDIRSNLLLAIAGAKRRAGFASAGGGPVLTDVVVHDPRQHTSTNTLRLVEQIFGVDRSVPPDDRRIALPPAAHAKAQALVGSAARLLGIHISGGRDIKQWDPVRFAAVASRLAGSTGATIVLTGTAGDEPLGRAFAAALPPGVPLIDLIGRVDLVELAALLSRLTILITGDTGPMHLAAAMGTPLVAIFGPSDPARYGPRHEASRVVRVDLPCSPCNRIRLPPRRCVGHIPDCLAGVSVDAVVAAAAGLLARYPTGAVSLKS